MFKRIIVPMGNGKYINIHFRLLFRCWDYSFTWFWPDFAQNLGNILALLNALSDHSLPWI